jgi:hypothetical protein
MPKSRRISIEMNEDIKQGLEKASKHLGISQAAIMRYALIRFFDERRSVEHGQNTFK